jgi:hypothetical protein
MLSELSEKVLSGEVKSGPGQVVNYIANTRLRCLELERKLKETEELEDRLGRLERARQARGDTRWHG